MAQGEKRSCQARLWRVLAPSGDQRYETMVVATLLVVLM